MCNCNNYKGGGCGCESGFGGRAKARKQLRKEEGLTRREARKVVKITTKTQKTNKLLGKLDVSNPALSGVLEKAGVANANLLAGNPNLNREEGGGAKMATEQGGNPTLQANPALQPATATATGNQPTQQNPAMANTMSQSNYNPSFAPQQPPQKEVAEEVEVEEVAAEEGEGETETTDNNAGNKPKKMDAKKMWFIIGAIVGLLLIILLLFFIFRKPQ